MTAYYAKYEVVALATPPYGPEVNQTSYVTIGGQRVTQTFWSSNQFGINRCELVGLVPASSLTSSELTDSFSWDPVGTIFYSYARTIEIDDPSEIPDEYQLPPGSKEPESLSFETGIASGDWGTISVSPSAEIDLYSGFRYVADTLAEGRVFGGAVSRVMSTVSVYNTLRTFMDHALDVVGDGIRNFETIDAQTYNNRADALMRDAYADFTAELERQLGSRPAASTAIKSINMFVAYQNGDAELSLTYSPRVDLTPVPGLLMVGVDVTYVTGSNVRDVIFNQGAAATARVAVPTDLYPDVAASFDVFGLRGGNDVFFGSEAAEYVNGGTGRDVVVGNAGDDFLRGGWDSDRLLGGAGADVLEGGPGADYLFGALGRNGADYSASAGGVSVDLTSGRGALNDAAGDALLSISDVGGSAYADTLGGDAENNALLGRGGNDSIAGGRGNDAVDGGAGADRLDGGVGIDTVSYASSRSGVFIQLFSGHADGGAARGDVISNFENAAGSQFRDILSGSPQDNTLRGLAGSDSLRGGLGADLLVGGAGDDTLESGLGSDTMVGGAGADVFRIVADLTPDGSIDVDEIRDFTSGTDKLEFVGFAVEGMTPADIVALTYQDAFRPLVWIDLLAYHNLEIELPNVTGLQESDILVS